MKNFGKEESLEIEDDSDLPDLEDYLFFNNNSRSSSLKNIIIGETISIRQRHAIRDIETYFIHPLETPDSEKIGLASIMNNHKEKKITPSIAVLFIVDDNTSIIKENKPNKKYDIHKNKIKYSTNPKKYPFKNMNVKPMKHKKSYR